MPLPPLVRRLTGGLLLLFLVVFGGSPAEAGVTTVALSPVRDAVATRQEVALDDPETPKAVLRALEKSLGLLDRPRTLLEEELRDASKAFRLLDKKLSGDATVTPTLAPALELMKADVRAEYKLLEEWKGHLATRKEEKVLLKMLRRAVRTLEKGLLARNRSLAARQLGKTAKITRKTMEKLGIEGPPPPDVPFSGPAPDFALFDKNPSSASFETEISPGDFAGKITAWYFLEAT